MSFPPSSHQVPVFLVTGIDDEAVAAATMGLQWDLPSPVVLAYTIERQSQHLIRVVSDLTGVLEREVIDLAHACVHCAIREDVIPTLVRLAGLHRWESIVARLPLAAEAMQVCRVAGYEPSRVAELRIAGVIAAVRGESAGDDLSGTDLLPERGVDIFDGDERGVAEVAAGLIEYADIVTVHGEIDAGSADLVRALARPGAMVVTDWPGFDGRQLAAGIHDLNSTEAWVAEVQRGPLPPLTESGVWRLELTSERPFHPQRLQDQIEILGTGAHRSRGCFWLPSRPEAVCAWNGAGGQLSIGVAGQWRFREQPITRIVVTGRHADGDPRAELREAFTTALLTDAEVASRDLYWPVRRDGLEPWLGAISETA